MVIEETNANLLLRDAMERNHLVKSECANRVQKSELGLHTVKYEPEGPRRMLFGKGTLQPVLRGSSSPGFFEWSSDVELGHSFEIELTHSFLLRHCPIIKVVRQMHPGIVPVPVVNKVTRRVLL
jgi:hypothetical protein